MLRADHGSLLLWGARAAWLALGPVGALAFGEALDERSAPVQLVAAIGLWTAWGAALVALWALSTASLTASRLLVSAALPALAVAAWSGATFTSSVLGLTLALVATLGTFSAEFGERAVQASAYGAERRLPLRPPAPMVAPMALTWCVLVAAVLGGPLLLAAGNVAAGIPVTAIAAALAAWVGPRFHRLSRRWLVLVPAGLVVHDQVVLAETVMVGRQQIVGVRLAPADTDALDLTGITWGTAVEIRLADQTMVVPSGMARSEPAAPVETTSILVSPSRPGRALAAMGEARLPLA